MTDLEDVLPPNKKPNAGWKNIEEANKRRYIEKVKKDRDEGWP